MSDEKKVKILDYIQWGVIGILLVICYFQATRLHDVKDEMTTRTEESYIKIYDSQTIEDLRLRNRRLEDSIKSLSSLESVTEIKYVIKHHTDTVYRDSPFYMVKEDSVSTQPNDSIYHYEEKTDTISYTLDIKADNLYWHRLDFEVDDDLMLINREDNGIVSTSVMGNYGYVEDMNAWHRKNRTWKDNFSFGVTAGFGYGFIHNRSDLFLGVGVTYRLF